MCQDKVSARFCVIEYDSLNQALHVQVCGENFQDFSSTSTISGILKRRFHVCGTIRFLQTSSDLAMDT